MEIDAFVEWGYLEPKDREDICAIEQGGERVRQRQAGNSGTSGGRGKGS